METSKQTRKQTTNPNQLWIEALPWVVEYPCWSREQGYYIEQEFYATEEEAYAAADEVVFGELPRVFCSPSLAVPAEQRTMRPGLQLSWDDLRDWLAEERGDYCPERP